MPPTVKRYRFHGLLEITVDRGLSQAVQEAIDFQLGPFLEEGEGDSGAPRLRVMRYARRPRLDEYVSHEFHGSLASDGGVWDSPHLRMAVDWSDSDSIDVYTDGVEFLINLYIQLLILRQGMTLVHAAAVADENGDCTLLPGPGGVGKTALLAHLVRDRGWRTLGDDIVVLTRDGRCLSFPRRFILKDYHRDVYPEAFAWYEGMQATPPWVRRGMPRLVEAVRTNAPFLGLAKWLLARAGLLGRVTDRVSTVTATDAIAVPVDKVLGPGSMCHEARITRVVYLSRHGGRHPSLHELAGEELAERMLAVLHHEWSASMRQLFTLGAVGLVDVGDYFQSVRAVMGKAVSNARLSALCIPTGATPQELAANFDELVT